MNYLIIPDVHGRSFWKEPVYEALKDDDTMIIFLGDYLDPYPDEFSNKTYKEDCISMFQDIIDIKKTHKERVVLLLGNHDAGYCISNIICECRQDYKNYEKISSMFIDNRDLFQMTYSVKINNTNVVFSHAGISKTWIDEDLKRFISEDEKKYLDDVPNFLNMIWLENKAKIDNDYYGLAVYSNYRGWSDAKYGSPLWSDIREWAKDESDSEWFNIVGHTNLGEGTYKGVFFKNIAMLDVHKPFYIIDGKMFDWDKTTCLKEF